MPRRTLTIGHRHMTDRTTTAPKPRKYPELRLSAPLLADAGFEPGEVVTVESRPGRIVVTRCVDAVPKKMKACAK